MKHIELLSEFNTAISNLSVQVEASTAGGLFDINKVSENLVLGLLRELYGWKGLQNLNSAEKMNFPGIDLADEQARVAIQVTSTSSLDKVKKTIDTFLLHNLDSKYDRLIVYVLSRKQTSYSQEALNRSGSLCQDNKPRELSETMAG